MEKTNYEANRLIFLNLTEKLFQREKYEAALSLAEERLRLYPGDIDASVAKSNALIGLNRFNEVQNIFREIENKISSLSAVYLQVGDFYGKSGYKNDAVDCYRKFINFHPFSDLAKQAEVKLVKLVQEDQLALNLDESVEPEETAKPDIYTVTLADLYIKQGHFKMAVDVLIELLKREPENQQAVDKLTYVENELIRQKKIREDSVKENKLLSTLTGWLENIGRLKKHA